MENSVGCTCFCFQFRALDRYRWGDSALVQKLYIEMVSKTCALFFLRLDGCLPMLLAVMKLLECCGKLEDSFAIESGIPG